MMLPYLGVPSVVLGGSKTVLGTQVKVFPIDSRRWVLEDCYHADRESLVVI